MKADDDESKPIKYASAKDELKALVATTAGQAVRVFDLDAIEGLLVSAGITLDEFVAEAQQHCWGRVKNPVGFLKSLAKQFRAKTQRASAPVTAAEAEEKNYRCPICSSLVRGEGAVLGPDGKERPCQCASPAYIKRLRERGVFPPEAAQ